MASVEVLLSYLLHKIAAPEGLPANRLALMLYLADWRSTILGRPPLSPVRWSLGPYGPKSDEVNLAFRNNPNQFELVDVPVEHVTKRLVRPAPSETPPTLDESDRAILDFVVERTRNLSSDRFFRLVFSTYPVLKASVGGEQLDLEQLAGEYREEVALRLGHPEAPAPVPASER